MKSFHMLQSYEICRSIREKSIKIPEQYESYFLEKDEPLLDVLGNV